MEFNPETFLERVSAYKLDLEKQARQTVEKMAITGQSLLQDRIQKNGLPGESYSKQYAKIRKSKGRQTGKVDLTMTSRMWNGTKLLRSTSETPYRFKAEVGGTDEEVDNKLIWMLDLYGPTVFDSSREEEAEVSEIAEDLLTNALKNFLE